MRRLLPVNFLKFRLVLNKKTFSGSNMGPPSMVPLSGPGNYSGDSGVPRKRKKKPKKAKLLSSPAQAASLTEGEGEKIH